jgi:hypothetical protein
VLAVDAENDNYIAGQFHVIQTAPERDCSVEREVSNWLAAS